MFAPALSLSLYFIHPKEKKKQQGGKRGSFQVRLIKPCGKGDFYFFLHASLFSLLRLDFFLFESTSRKRILRNAKKFLHTSVLYWLPILVRRPLLAASYA